MKPQDFPPRQGIHLEARDPVSGRPRGTAARLQAFADDLMARHTDALLITQGGRTHVERYAPEWGPTRPHSTASLAKTLVGAMGLVLAWGDGRIAPEDPACVYIPRWEGDPQRGSITVGQLAAHTAGLDDAEEGGLPHDQLTGWKGRFWRRDPDPFTIARDEATMANAPGTQYLYSNPGNAMLGYCVTASLHGAPQPDLHGLLRDRLLRPVGVPDAEWAIGYGAPTVIDGLSLYATWGGAGFTARATAAVGRLLLHKGRWGGKTVLDPERVRLLLTEVGTPRPLRAAGSPQPANGLAIWLNVDGAWPELPRDAVAGAGAGHQLLLVVPSLDLVAVRYGGQLAPGPDFWTPLHRHVFAPLAAALD